MKVIIQDIPQKTLSKEFFTLLERVAGVTICFKGNKIDLEINDATEVFVTLKEVR